MQTWERRARGGALVRMKTFYWSMPDQWTTPAIATCQERNLCFMHMYQLFVKHCKLFSLNILSFYRILRHCIHFVIQVLSGRQIMQHLSYVYLTAYCSVNSLYQSSWETVETCFDLTATRSCGAINSTKHLSLSIYLNGINQDRQRFHYICSDF